MNKEILNIINLVKKEKITSEEGTRLIDASINTAKENTPPNKGVLRVRINTSSPEDNEFVKVNISLPLAIAKQAAKFLSITPKKVKKELKEDGIDLDAIDVSGFIDLIAKENFKDEFVDIKTGNSQDGTTVKIFIE